MDFHSKVVCKNSSVTIWEILFNIAIPITRGGCRKTASVRPPRGVPRGGLMKTFHRHRYAQKSISAMHICTDTHRNKYEFTCGTVHLFHSYIVCSEFPSFEHYPLYRAHINQNNIIILTTGTS